MKKNKKKMADDKPWKWPMTFDELQFIRRLINC